jgi:hypothetical protein
VVPLAISGRWRWFSFVFGVLVPLGVWGYLASALRPDSGRMSEFVLINCVFVLLQSAALAWFLFARAPARWVGRALCIWLSAGGAYAFVWALLCMLAWPGVLHNDGAPLGARLAGLVYICAPLPCIWIYFGNARLAGAAATSEAPPVPTA